ncbi:MAG: hypothetical protein Q8M01_22615 [Rubrivivax sp.]|nr:hypothetical protein [Rubrivivax sp.]
MADDEKPNAGAVSPVSPVVPTETTQVAAAAPCELEGLAGESTGAGINTCGDCLHLLPHGTCAEPVTAGLLATEDGFGIAWPPEGQGTACPAFIGKLPMAAADRPRRLTDDEVDRCHVPCWDDAEIAAFTARTERFALPSRADADDRRLCQECRHLAGTAATGWRCGNHKAAGLQGRDIAADFAVLLQRCPGWMA